MKALFKRLFPPKQRRFKEGDKIRLKVARNAFFAGINRTHEQCYIPPYLTLSFLNENKDNYIFSVWLGDTKEEVYISKVSFENLIYIKL